MVKKLGYRSVIGLVLAAGVVGLAACGGGDGQVDLNPGVAEDPVTITEAPSNPDAAAGVCTGTPNRDAADYDQRNGTVTVFQKNPGSSDYVFRSYLDQLPEGTVALEPSQASVVVCLDVTNSEVIDTCTYTDEQSGEDFTLEIASASYDVKIFEAQTGRKIDDEVDLEEDARECPASATFTEGENSQIDYARPITTLETLLQPIAYGGL